MKKTKKAKKSARKPSEKLGVVGGMIAAEGKTGLTHAVIQAAKNAGAGPGVFRQNGNVDCDALVDFVARNPALLTEAEVTLNLEFERALDVRASRKLKEQRWAEREKLLLPVDQVRRAFTKNIIAAKTKLYTAENAVPVEVGMTLGLTTEQVNIVKESFTRHIRRILKELHTGEWGECKCAKCGEVVL